MAEYIVRKGDTLSAIARSYNVTVAELASANGIRNPNFIQVGQTLRIPTKEGTKPTNNNQVYNALVTCLDAIEDLPEFKQLEALLNG